MDFEVGQTFAGRYHQYLFFRGGASQYCPKKNQALDDQLEQNQQITDPETVLDSNNPPEMDVQGTLAASNSNQFISEVEVVSVDDKCMSCQMQVEAGGIGVIIPPELHGNLAAGGVNLLFKSVPPQEPGEPVTLHFFFHKKCFRALKTHLRTCCDHKKVI